MLNILDVLDMTIKEINIRLTTERSNNNINNEFHIEILGISDAVIKNMDVKPIIKKINNKKNVKVDMSMFMDETISTIDIKLNIDKFH